MIPAAFEYARASSVAEASKLLKQYGEDAKVLAGGHSLIPLMRLRLAQPKALVDINGIKELDHVKEDGSKLRIGALTRHVTLQNSQLVKDKLPILAEVAAEVGDNQVRNMGTIGGVVAHADAAGDYPTIALMLDAEIVTNQRTIAAKDFFKDIFTTPLAADEIVTEIVFPVATGPHKYIKFRRRLFDWAIVGAAAQKVDGGWRIGLSSWSGAASMVFANNVCYSQGSQSVQVSGGTAGVTFAGNVVFGAVLGVAGGPGVFTPTANVGNPLGDFTSVAWDASLRNARPVIGCTIIGSGNATYAVAVDITGAARAPALESGCYDGP